MAALRLGGAVEMEVVEVDSSVGTAFFTLDWGLAFAEVLVALFSTGHCSFDVESSSCLCLRGRSA